MQSIGKEAARERLAAERIQESVHSGEPEGVYTPPVVSDDELELESARR